MRLLKEDIISMGVEIFISPPCDEGRSLIRVLEIVRARAAERDAYFHNRCIYTDAPPYGYIYTDAYLHRYIEDYLDQYTEGSPHQFKYPTMRKRGWFFFASLFGFRETCLDFFYYLASVNPLKRSGDLLSVIENFIVLFAASNPKPYSNSNRTPVPLVELVVRQFPKDMMTIIAGMPKTFCSSWCSHDFEGASSSPSSWRHAFDAGIKKHFSTAGHLEKRPKCREVFFGDLAAI